MDRSVQHAFDAEEIMAYLDGELEPQRAAALAAHLVGCGECQEVAKSFRAVSERMMSFDVESAPTSFNNEAVIDAAGLGTFPKNTPRTNQKNTWNFRRLLTNRYGWVLAASAVGALLVILALPNFFKAHRAARLAAQRATGLSAPDEDQQRLELYAKLQPEPDVPAARGKLPTFVTRSGANAYQNAAQTEGLDTLAPAPPPRGDLQAPETVGPMIAQTASLSIVAANYDEASAAIERLAAAHGGYVEKLDAKAQTGSARELSATLRIPAKQLDGFLTDLRKLGHVEEESRGNEEVSAQYVDLQARLRAARATEQRLIELLGSRTGKLSDVLEAERELARVRGEIESMQGENAVLVHRVSYATVQVELSEVYRERLTVDSKGTKLRNALVEGLTNVEDGAVALLLFLLAFGPSFLFWLAILLVPAWLLWRRFRRRAQA